MRQKQEAKPGSVEKTVRDIRRATRRRHSSEDKIRIVLEGLRGIGIARLCDPPAEWSGQYRKLGLTSPYLAH